MIKTILSVIIICGILSSASSSKRLLQFAQPSIPGQQPETIPGQQPVTIPGQSIPTVPGQQPVTIPGQQPVVTIPGQQPVLLPGQQPSTNGVYVPPQLPPMDAYDPSFVQYPQPSPQIYIPPRGNQPGYLYQYGSQPVNPNQNAVIPGTNIPLAILPNGGQPIPRGGVILPPLYDCC